MAWLPWKPHGDEEAGLKLGRLKPGQARGPRRLVPWWVGAMRRAKAASVMRRQPKTSSGRRRPAAASAILAKVYGRRSVVKASFRRNRHNGGWVRHARYLAREQAQREGERGQGFDRELERPRYGGGGAGVGARRRLDVVIDHLAGRCRADRSAAARARLRGRRWSATSARSWSGSRSIITTPTTSTFIC